MNDKLKYGILFTKTEDVIENSEIDISDSIFYRLFKFDKYIISRVNPDVFLDKLFEDELTLEDLFCFFEKSIIVEGRIIDSTSFQVNKIFELENFLEYKNYLGSKNQKVKLTSICKKCGIPEDECRLEWWIYSQAESFNPFTIENSGNQLIGVINT